MSHIEDRNALIARSLDPDLLIRHALERGLVEEAADAIDELIEADRGHPEGWFLKGVHGLLCGDYRGALGSFDAALDRGADRRVARLGRVQALAGAGDLAEAWSALAELAPDAPGDREILHWGVRVGAALECWEDLGLFLERHLELDPNDDSARFAHAGVQVRLGNFDLAREQHDLLRERQPDLEGLDELARGIGTVSLVASAA